MIRATFLLAISFWLAGPLLAQDGHPLSLPTADGAPAETGGIRDIHITDLLNRTPEGRAALRAYLAAREAGTLPTAAKSARTYRVGETRDFMVATEILPGTASTRTSLNFTLRSANTAANLWIETDLTGTVSDADVQALADLLLTHTPEGSFRPAAGIIENDNYLFGDPPDRDGDGKLDILLHDIQEAEAAGCCVLGYVTAVDLVETEGSNLADILYVDLPDGLQRGGVEGVASTAAHEYQHLINYHYQQTYGDEWTFVNEGLSEWASVINGLYDRGISYLGVTAEHNTNLLDWRTTPEIAQREYDYQRAALFTGYLAQRLGPEETGSIVRAQIELVPSRPEYAVGARGYEAVLERNGLTLTDVVADFHTANFVNDPALEGGRYGYALEIYNKHNLPVVPSRSFDGRQAATTQLPDFTVAKGAVQYLSWDNVADFTFTGDVFSGYAPSLIPGLRTRMRMHAFLEYTDGRREIREIAAGPEQHTFEGEFSRVTVAVMHIAPEKTEVRFSLSASWGTGSGEIQVETLQYDTGQIAGSPFSLSAGANGVQATRFAVPHASAQLTGVAIAPYFLSQFSNGGQPQDAPRDVTLKVWTAGANGLPDAELLSLPMQDPRANNGASSAFNFIEIDLAAHSDALSNLPDTIFVGFTEAGTDANYMVVGASAYAAANVSYIGSYTGNPMTNRWTRLWDVQFSGSAEDEYPMQGTAIPIRATFRYSTTSVAVEGGDELPGAVTLAQNYPNPFNPATTIRYALPEAAEVHLAVYDLLGRRVALLADGLQPAGAHTVALDASTWASGVYVYTLQTATQTLTRKMLLVK